MGASMAQDDHKLFVTPVSVSDGFKRADGRTWFILLIGAVAAFVIVMLVNLFVEKPNVRWPSSPTQTQPAAQQPASDEPASDEPRTYDVAPPSSVPPPG
jgi:hypothetical protein